MRLVDNWRALKHAWSVRLLFIAAVLSGLEVALPHAERETRHGRDAEGVSGAPTATHGEGVPLWRGAV
ncbi:hypothetical protein [Mesorhizobium sp. M0276]|uniref:DUF7940 domain-containing protein n=1 Tax=Mesorhizobium sp. M0276 TaxID=2956928 RepID=UPI0033353958